MEKISFKPSFRQAVGRKNSNKGRLSLSSPKPFIQESDFRTLMPPSNMLSPMLPRRSGR